MQLHLEATPERETAVASLGLLPGARPVQAAMC